VEAAQTWPPIQYRREKLPALASVWFAANVWTALALGRTSLIAVRISLDCGVKVSSALAAVEAHMSSLSSSCEPRYPPLLRADATANAVWEHTSAA
jgi:hypothetical protein